MHGEASRVASGSGSRSTRPRQSNCITGASRHTAACGWVKRRSSALALRNCSAAWKTTERRPSFAAADAALASE
eukprot:2723502-Prymnesium_polylepis.1